MDNNGRETRKPLKNTINKASKKSKPVKVVYISNPMKITAKASEFMALVQEFTGRDSVLPDPPRFESDSSVEEVMVVTHGGSEQLSASIDTDSSNSTSATFPANPYDAFGGDDDVFMPSFEGFPAMSSSSSLWYESTHRSAA